MLAEALHIHHSWRTLMPSPSLSIDQVPANTAHMHSTPSRAGSQTGSINHIDTHMEACGLAHCHSHWEAAKQVHHYSFFMHTRAKQPPGGQHRHVPAV